MSDVPQGVLDLLSSGRSIAILGIGNSLVGHDVFGSLFVDLLHDIAPSNWLVLNCGTVPENFVGKVVRNAPSVVIFVDTFIDYQRSERVLFCRAEDIRDVSFGTHKLSLSHLVRFMSSSLDSEYWFFGVNAEKCDFNCQTAFAHIVCDMVHNLI